MATQVSTLLTAEEFYALGDIGPAELIYGKVVRLVAPKPKHGWITMQLGSMIHQFVEMHKLGKVYAAETGYLLERDPDLVRCPDISFVRAQLADGHNDNDYYAHSPDLAVEVLSPSERPEKVKEKIQVWLSFGARSVWLLDPDERSLAVHRADSPPRIYREHEVFQDSVVLSGFEIAPLSRVFPPK
jgi:Uma2 family endonuclease